MHIIIFSSQQLRHICVLGDESTGCTTNETIWREDPYKRCAKDVFIVPILLAIYMILTNILLVNLLIAMFR